MLASNDTLKARLAFCFGCEERRATLGVSKCLKCSCFIAFKVRISSASCPKNKWGPE